MNARRLASCHCCGLVQVLPDIPQGYSPVCVRCATTRRHASARRNRLTAALAASALALYVPAMLLPMLRIERLGHSHEDSLLSGVAALWSQGYWVVGAVVFLCSVLLPPLKLIVLWLLSGTAVVNRHHHRAGLYHLVEFLGRWGMLDVMLVAILVAFVKLGDLINIYPGKGLLAFTAMVLLSLLASLAFNPVLMWEPPEDQV